MKKYYVGIFTCSMLLTAVLVSCNRPSIKEPSETQNTSAYLPEVAFDHVKLLPFETVIDAAGTVKLDRYEVVTEFGNSTILELPVSPFQRVKKGDLLLALKNADVRVEFSKVLEDYRKQKALYEIDRKQRTNQSDTVRLKSFYGLTYLEELIEQYQNRLKMENRYAPFDGIVHFKKTFLAGETLPGGTEVLTVIREGGGMLEISLPSIYAEKIRPGMPVVVERIKEKQHIQDGAISSQTPNVIMVSLALPPSHGFRDGERLITKIVTEELGEVPVIPRTALLRRNAGYLFFTLNETDSLALWIPLKNPKMNESWVHSAELGRFLHKPVAIGNHQLLTHFQKVKPVIVENPEN